MKILRLIFSTLFFFKLFTTFAQERPVLEWAESFAGNESPNSGNSIAVDSKGNVYSTGVFRSDADFDPGSISYQLYSKSVQDLYISKLDTKGRFLWAKQIGFENGAEGKFIKVDPFGDVVVTGIFQGTTDFDPEKRFSNRPLAGPSDVFILKLSSDGDFIWAKSFGGPKSDEETSFSLDFDSKGNIYSTGRFSQSADFDPGITDFYLTATGPYSAYVSKLNVNGDFIWAKNLNGANATGQSIVVGEKGDVYVCGNFGQGTVDFDPGSKGYILSAGLGNGFLLKLTNDGNFVWAKKVALTEKI